MKNFISTAEAAKLLGISRIAVFKKIKKGEIKAKKIGRNFVIDKKNLASSLGETISEKTKKQIAEAVKKVVREYGETLKLLGQE